MINIVCNKNLLSYCIRTFPTADIQHQLISLVNEHDGLIYGSVMAAYMLGSPTMNGYKADDIDILFKTRVDLNRFIRDAKKIEDLIDSNAEYSHSKMSLYPTLYSYAFTDILSQNDIVYAPELQQIHYENSHNDVSLIFSWFNSESGLFNKLKIHAMCLKETALEGIENIPESYINNLFSRFFIFDFTKTVYYQGKVYSYLNNIRQVSIRLFELDTKSKINMIRKYTQRGIHFTIVDSFEDTRIDRKLLEDSKNHYRSIGLVVIPISTRDNEGAGKAPNVSGWCDKTPEFDFDVSSCDNIGIVCGQASGIVCIDVDLKDNGMLYFNKMIGVYGLPECPIQMTPNGGLHYIFKYNNKRMNQMSPKVKGAIINDTKIGIDLWIRRCQFIVEPSVNHSINKPYKWINPIVSRDSIP